MGKDHSKLKQTEIGIIPEDWEVKKLGDVVTFQRGYDLPIARFTSGKYPVIKSNGLAGYNSEFKARGPGVLLGRSGRIGEPMFVEEDYWPHNTTLFSKEFHNAIPRFIYYLLKTLHLETYNAGSAVPTLNRNHIHPILIALPPLPEQQSITKVLSDLDNKIELNQQMNNSLEATAQAIFKHWFVDFEFPDEDGKPYKSNKGKLIDSEIGKIPEKWEIKSLEDIANYLNGLALQKFPPTGSGDLPVIKIRELNQGSTEGSNWANNTVPSNYIVNDGDVLFSWSGSLELRIWCGGKGALNQHLFKVTSSKFPRWFIYYWTKEYLQTFRQIAAGKATTMGHIQRHHLTDSLVALPPKMLIQRADRLLNPLIEAYIKNVVEAHTLAAMRDALLPKLMSGKIRVPLEVIHNA
jgi:type I restriction enzyme S subunit